MRLGVDIMGGDYAPLEIVKGAIEAYSELPSNVRLVLFGDQEQIHKVCLENNFDPSNFDIVATTEVIEMLDHPAKAFQSKTNSSIVVGFVHLSKGLIDSFASVGNTGAMLAGAMMVIKPIEGISRPCISTHLPKLDGANGLLLDVGINADVKPENLLQYAILGSTYSKEVFGIDNPRVALLNIGSEAGKGNLLARETYELLSKSSQINFIGNVEGSDLFRPNLADVIVTDGFTGNIVLKHTESFYRVALKRGINDEFINRFNFELYGGTAVLGVAKNIIIGHGVSKAIAVKNMIHHSYKVAKANLSLKIAKKIAGEL
ncbi:MAG TPA: phosphate acyltransferase PlsX, partial [Salinivirgaceae bacterium]|nr:phosphate acyltransferase PlsX [Salinivirgaceae bacterium]